MTTGLFGGLALFLFGMEQMTEALKAVAGTRMKEVLGRLTTNRLSGAFTGALVTAVIQSSSVTTVLVVGFVSAGVMTLTQSVGVIMGANIGTTITAQVIAFKITKLALVFIAAGFAVDFFSRQETVRRYGTIVFGLGLIFFGMNIMGEAMGPLRNYPPFIELMQGMARPGLGIVCGALFTALVQSSSATTGIVVVMASQGFITLPAGIALALGANIGTCVTALLAALGKSRPALRAAAVHVVFNLLGALLWLGGIDQLAALATQISPQHGALQGLERLAAETPRQIANANTLFNVLNTLLFIGFAVPMTRLVTWIFPAREPDAARVIISPRFLDDELIDTPAMALNVARLEVGHLGEQVLKMMMLAQHAIHARDESLLQELEKQDDAADILYAEINAYLNRVGKQTLSEEESQDYYRISQANGYLEGIGDVLESDLAALGRKIIRENLQPSETMQLLLTDLLEGVFRGVGKAVQTVTENDQKAAQEVISLRSEINRRVTAANERQAQSLAESGEARLATLNVEFELTDKLKRIYSLSKRIARLWVPSEV
ncbi:Na/Pi cotransporter family protein [uncultured Desulfuromonas sp.]|uniref:Na/Pi cotransporter family protein n=1 Tax=uncultured Desulfuromonas sp. TaxID=181013 RepID=UPI002632D02E|nr:Na/Pi cotransporter family protein [uncultured Desulfuromonas sp.]